jgi:hypothetical protein
MGITFTFSAGNRALPASVGNVIAKVGSCSLGDAGDVTEWDPGQDTLAAATLGQGPLAERVQRACTLTGQRTIAVKSATSTVATKSAVSHLDDDGDAGTGPTVTVAGTPLDSLTVRLKVTTAGALGTAKAEYALDGDTYIGECDLGLELVASLRGTVDLTGITLSSLNTLTVIANPDGAGSQTTILTTPTSVADIATQINATAGTLVARIVAGRYLQLEGAVTGTTGTLDVGAGTANTILGFAADPASVLGTASTFAVPKTGLTFTFPTGTYVIDETYTVTTVQPKMTLSDLDDALDALRSSGLRFGVVEICQEPVDGADLLARCSALDTKIASWHNAESDRIFPIWLMGSPLGSTSTVEATRNTAHATNDADVRDAMAGHASNYGEVVHGDMFVQGVDIIGSFRRSLCIPRAESAAAHRASADPGNGAFDPNGLPLCSMVGPDGLTKARDELFATVKMGDRRFTVATRRDNLPRFKAGQTRAATGSKFGFPGVLRMAYIGGDRAYQRMRLVENVDLSLAADGTLRPAIADAYDKLFTSDLKAALIDEEEHASAVLATLDRSIVAAADGTYAMTITWSAQMKGQVRNIIATFSVTTQLALS